MKVSKKIIALLVAVSIVLSIVIPLSLTSGAVAVTGINASIYRAESYLGGRNLYQDSNEARVSYENNQQFDATIEGLLESSALVSTQTGVTGISTKAGEYTMTKWTGTMTASTSGEYTIIGRKIDNGFVMFVDGVKVYEYWGASHWFDGDSDRLLSDLGSFTVTAGQTYEVEMYYLELSGGEALSIYATTTPDDLDSGANINDTFTFDLTEEYYLNLDTDANLNTVIGIGTGANGTGAGGNQGLCIEDNFKYDESIDTLLESFDFRGSSVVSTFAEAVYADDRYIIVYEGVMVPKTSGTYTFGATSVDNGFYLEINDTTVYEFWAGATWNDDGTTNTYTSSISLTAGTAYPFKAAFLEIDGGQVLSLNATIGSGTATSLPDLFTFYPASASLSFNLGGVNLLSGATTVTSSSVLTVQYTDATLGDNIEMFAKITKTDGTVLVEKQQVTSSGWLKPISTTIVGAKEELGVSSEGETGTKTVYSNTAGAITFKPSISGTYSVSDLKVTIWTENTAMSNISSPKATTTINNGFTTGTPSGLTGSNWMSYIDGATLLPQINMPGTHDAGSVYFKNLASYNKCQNVHINTQLTYGARYFDIRPSSTDGTASNNTTVETTLSNGETVTDFAISHSSYLAYLDSSNSTTLKFSQIYEWCKAFLETNPSECIVMGFNNENINDRSILINAIHTFVDADPELFYTKGNEIPTLDDVRGKIVLLRRFPGVYAGADNSFMDFYWIDQHDGTTPHAMVPVSSSNAVTTYYVQDAYGLAPTDTEASDCEEGSIGKISTAKNHVTKAETEKKASEYYINFFSTSNNQYPSSMAEEVNPAFTSDVTLTKGNQYGWLLFDFITTEIAQKVYLSNTFTSTAWTSTSDNGKVVHYDFADVENGMVDDTEDNGFDGTMENVDALSVNSIYDIINFNNENRTGSSGAGYVSIPQSVFQGTGDTVTVQVWIKDTGSNARDTWFSIGKDSNGVSGNYFVANTKWDGEGARYALSSTKVGSSAGFSAAGTVNSANTWHLLTYVIDGSDFKIYVDGSSTASVTGSTYANFADLDPGIFVNSPIYLGAPNYLSTDDAFMGSDDAFIGSMGDFTIYNYAVSTSEIAATYKELAEEYTYILEVALDNGVTAIASETTMKTYIDEQYNDTGSKICFTLPSDYDLTKAKLSLEYDGAKVEISTDGGRNYATFSADTAYDLSKDVVLKVTSLNGTRTKEYEVAVNGIIVKDYATDAFVELYNPESNSMTLPTKDGYLTAWYDSTRSNKITTASNGDIIYVNQVELETPGTSGKSIRVDTPAGLRFKASINLGEFYSYFNAAGDDYVYSEDADFTFGMLIIPEDLLTGELTEETAKVKNIVAKKIYNQNNNGELEYTGVITSIPESQYERNLVARSYIKYTYNGTTYTIYSEQTEVANYKGVATQVYNDTDISQDIKDALKEIFGDSLGG